MSDVNPYNLGEPTTNSNSSNPMTQSENKRVAREIALWLYGPDEGMSEGLVRTLIDKIRNALDTKDRQREEAVRGLTQENKMLESENETLRSQNSDGIEENKRLREALERILATDTMITAVHAANESYKIARDALNGGAEG